MKHLGFKDEDMQRMAAALKASHTAAVDRYEASVRAGRRPAGQPFDGGSVTWLGPGYDENPEDFAVYDIDPDSLALKYKSGERREIHSTWPHGIDETPRPA